MGVTVDTSRAIIAMERNGVYVDRDVASDIERRARADEREVLGELEPWFWEHGWVDRDEPVLTFKTVDKLWSSQALHAFLHSELGLSLKPSPFWAKGQVKPGDIKIDHTALEWLAGQYPEHRDNLNLLLRLRRVRSGIKYATKIPAAIQPDGLVHPTFGPASDADERSGTVSGRLAAKNPEVHQIPSDKEKDAYGIRRMFTAPPGQCLIVADYSALEVVVLAWLIMILFNDDGLAKRVAPGAPDIHATTAHFVFRLLQDPVALELSEEDFVKAAKKGVGTPEQVAHCEWLRKVVKTIRYGLNYGKGSYGFGNTLFLANGDPLGEERAQALIDGLLAFDPGIAKFGAWVDTWIARHHGIITPGGRWLDLSDYTRSGDKWQIAKAGRKARNFPMQGYAAELVNMAMVMVNSDQVLRSLGFVLSLQVHDELVMRGPEENADKALDRLKTIMESVGLYMPGRPFGLPLAVSAKKGHSWMECK